MQRIECHLSSLWVGCICGDRPWLDVIGLWKSPLVPRSCQKRKFAVLDDSFWKFRGILIRQPVGRKLSCGSASEKTLSCQSVVKGMPVRGHSSDLFACGISRLRCTCLCQPSVPIRNNSAYHGFAALLAQASGLAPKCKLRHSLERCGRQAKVWRKSCYSRWRFRFRKKRKGGRKRRSHRDQPHQSESHPPRSAGS